MKTIANLLIVIAAVLFIGTAHAQLTPNTQRMTLTGNDRANARIITFRQ